jgi:hypothetical protein
MMQNESAPTPLGALPRERRNRSEVLKAAGAMILLVAT